MERIMITGRSSLRRNRFERAASAKVKTGGDQKTKRKIELLSACLTGLSLLGTFLTLIGYGVALSVDQLGVPPESIFTSPFEVISLSIWAVLYFFDNVGNISFGAYYSDMLTQMWPMLAGGSVAIGAVFFLAKVTPHIEQVRRRYPRITRYISPPAKNDGHVVIASKLLIYFVLFWFAVPVLYLMTIFLFTFVSVGLAMAPYVGMAAGISHIKDDVLAPTACTPLRNREQRLKPPSRKKDHQAYAHCVSVKTERMQEGLRGRVVFSTSSSIVLFDPDTGAVTRIPIRDTTIQAVGTMSHLGS